MGDLNSVNMEEVLLSLNCSCGESFLCAPRYAGRKVRCPVCNAAHIIPDVVKFNSELNDFTPLFNGNSFSAKSSGSLIIEKEKALKERANVQKEPKSSSELLNQSSSTINQSSGSSISASTFDALFTKKETADESSVSSSSSLSKGKGGAAHSAKAAPIPEILQVHNPIARKSRKVSDSFKQLNNFHIIGLLAQGGMGKVCLARDEVLERTVVVKELRRELRSNKELQKRLVVEAKITGFLDHPGVVPVYALEVDKYGAPFYVMRKITGDSFEKAILEYQKNPNADDQRELLRHFVAACRTIAYAHSVRVLHRDIKPSNIMIGKFGVTFVVDWGLAVKYFPGDSGAVDSSDFSSSSDSDFDSSESSVDENDRMTRAGVRVGTRWYRDPDYLKTGVSRPYNDQYALGVILYKILTGKIPYFEKNMRDQDAILLKSITQPTVYKADPVISAVCMKALEKAPQDRYSSVEAFADDVQRWLENKPTSVYKPSLTSRLFGRS